MTQVTGDFQRDGGDQITVHDAKLLCPIDWRKGLSIHQKTLPLDISERVREDYPDAHAATYWTHVRSATTGLPLARL